jgi:hypothetical protein
MIFRNLIGSDKAEYPEKKVNLLNALKFQEERRRIGYQILNAITEKPTPK